MSLFSPRTFPVIMKDMLATLLASTPLDDVNYGSIWTTLLEAAAQEDDEQYFQMLEIIRGYSLDTTFGDELDDRALEYDIERQLASNASTTVTIADTAFEKIATSVYAGLSGPAAGSTSINGNTSVDFAASGSIVIGRGTPNVETIAYSSITEFSNYVRFNLSSALANDHGTDETIIYAQGGDRLISAGTIVKVPANDLSEEVIFTLDSNATILDGEDELTGIPVTASEAGTEANVPVGAISRFDSLPFATATVRNTARVTNGVDDESDQELRDRIKTTIQSLSRGTPTAIRTGVLGLVSTEDNKRVVSVSMRNTTNPADVVKLFVDDGTGFIPTFNHVGVETLISEATGGEKFLSVANFPLVKAFTETQNAEPYNIPHNSTLFVEVNGVVETITFLDSDFEVPGSAEAQEVLSKINSVAQTFESRVSSGGTKVRLFSRSNSEEEICVTGGTANSALGFQTDVKYTTKLYRERDFELTLLTKDGRTASIESGATAAYDVSGGLQHLCLIIDGKTENILKAWFDPADFVSPASLSAQDVCDVIEASCPGLVASPSSNDTRFSVSSTTTRSAASKVRVLSDFTSIFNEEGGLLVDRTEEMQTSATNQTLFAANGDYLYLGHEDVKFDSVWVKLLTLASATINPVFEIWNGSTWTAIGVTDGTSGFTASGNILFQPPRTWATTEVEDVEAYWLRISRTAAVLGTAPVESRIRICGANEQFELSETEVVGADLDYEMNRFVGQIELAEPLVAGDKITLGSYETRPYAVSGLGNFAGLLYQDFVWTVDGVETNVNFDDGDFADPDSATPQEVADVINTRGTGVTASVVAGGTRVKIQCNRWNNGTLIFASGDANATLGFPTTARTAFVPHVPSIESSEGPWEFELNDTLIVIVDDNFAATFTVPFFKAGVAAAGATVNTVVDTDLITTFPENGEISGFDIIFDGGANDGERRTVTGWDASTGEVYFFPAVDFAPAEDDEFQILPTDVDEVVYWLSNREITLLTTKVEVRDTDGGTRLQLASAAASEDAAIAVSGGNANAQLMFDDEVRGVDGYRHFTGLLQEVQWTVDGKDDDRENYPGLRAAGVHVEPLEPVTIPVELSIEVTTREGVSLGGIVNSIKSAVSNYVNRLEVGEDVILSEVIVAVKGVSGVFDAVVEDPEVNIAIADNELARISDDDIGVT